MRVFRVTGRINKPNWQTDFTKEVLVAKSTHAVEKIYAEMGSKHRVKRFQMKILKVEEVSPDEIENPILKRIVIEG